MQLNLPTGIPFVYTLDGNLKPIESLQFLGDPETVKKAMEAVAAQGKAKWTTRRVDLLWKFPLLIYALILNKLLYF